MLDVTFLIPDYQDWQEQLDYMPPSPDDLIPDREADRLFEKLCAMADSGAFDPERELPF